jgi:hypothetical protein
MNTRCWQDLREEVCTHLEIGKSNGETELDTMTRLIWLERQNAIAAIEEAVNFAHGRARELIVKEARKARVLQWKPRSRTHGPF